MLGQRSFFNNTDLPTGFLFSPLSTPLGEIPHCAEPPPQCKTCGAFANKFSEYDHASTAWICNFCGCGCVHPGGLPPEAPFKQCEDFDFLPAATDAALSNEQCWPALVSLVIDATLDADLLEEVVEACKVLLHRLPGNTLVSLLAFDSAVTLFELASPGQSPELPGPIQSWVLPGDAQATPAMLHRLCAASSGLIAPIGTCIHTACAALDTLRPLHHTLKSRVRPRCIGAALAATHGVFGLLPASFSSFNGLVEQLYGSVVEFLYASKPVHVLCSVFMCPVPTDPHFKFIGALNHAWGARWASLWRELTCMYACRLLQRGAAD